MLCGLDERDEILLLLCGTLEHWLDAVMETLLVFLLSEHPCLSLSLEDLSHVSTQCCKNPLVGDSN